VTDLRKLARNQECQVRLPGCDGGGETTVLAHYRLSGYCGTGLKPPDVMGAWCCAKCHDLIDGRAKLNGLAQEMISHDLIRLAHAEGCLRTIAALVKIGAVK